MVVVVLVVVVVVVVVLLFGRFFSVLELVTARMHLCN